VSTPGRFGGLLSLADDWSVDASDHVAACYPSTGMLNPKQVGDGGEDVF
jgi:hypothetical protein